VALNRVESTTRSTVALRLARFATAGNGRLALEGELAHTHTGPLDELEAGASLAWLARPGLAPVYPFVALAGAWRQESIGSFEVARYPVGLNVGVRMLAGDRALARIEYRFRRVLNDPINDFDEHQIMSGLSILFGNQP
jgi:hypothetical protein